MHLKEALVGRSLYLYSFDGGLMPCPALKDTTNAAFSSHFLFQASLDEMKRLHNTLVNSYSKLLKQYQCYWYHLLAPTGALIVTVVCYIYKIRKATF